MRPPKQPPPVKSDKADRDARLKAALKANIARRKAKARALAANGGAGDETGRNETGEDQD